MHCPLLCAVCSSNNPKRSLKNCHRFRKKGRRTGIVCIFQCVRVLRLVYAMHGELFKCPRSEKDHANAAAKLK